MEWYIYQSPKTFWLLLCSGYHSGIIRTLLYEIINTTPAYNSTVAQITTAIVNVLNTLTGTPQLRFTLVNANGSGLANVDATGKHIKFCTSRISTNIFLLESIIASCH
jgi:hypothetical protein